MSYHVAMKQAVGWISDNFWPLLPAIIGLVAVAVSAVESAGWTGQAPGPTRAAAPAKGSAAAGDRPATAATWSKTPCTRRELGLAPMVRSRPCTPTQVAGIESWIR